MDKKCVRRNTLGDCVEWVDFGDKKVVQFKEDAKKCNPDLYQEWKRITRDKKIKVME